MATFQVSSLELMGNSKVKIGGIVCDGEIHVGAEIASKDGLLIGQVEEIHFYGRRPSTVGRGMSAGIVIGRQVASEFALGDLLQVDESK